MCFRREWLSEASRERLSLVSEAQILTHNQQPLQQGDLVLGTITQPEIKRLYTAVERRFGSLDKLKGRIRMQADAGRRKNLEGKLDRGVDRLSAEMIDFWKAVAYHCHVKIDPTTAQIRAGWVVVQAGGGKVHRLTPAGIRQAEMGGEVDGGVREMLDGLLGGIGSGATTSQDGELHPELAEVLERVERTLRARHGGPVGDLPPELAELFGRLERTLHARHFGSAGRGDGGMEVFGIEDLFGAGGLPHGVSVITIGAPGGPQSVEEAIAQLTGRSRRRAAPAKPAETKAGDAKPAEASKATAGSNGSPAS